MPLTIAPTKLLVSIAGNSAPAIYALITPPSPTNVMPKRDVATMPGTAIMSNANTPIEINCGMTYALCRPQLLTGTPQKAIKIAAF
jgi:hypothetical protein